jgi:hypothetical protein
LALGGSLEIIQYLHEAQFWVRIAFSRP